MTIAYWCVLVAILLPYPFTVIAKASKRGFDNNKPRTWLGELDGRGARANWAQMNTFEALPGFIGAVVVAHLVNGPQFWIDLLAVNFIALRLAYGYAYVADHATLRSICWFAALGCVVALFVVSA
ncbi:MAG: MAPEG family protein [Pseudomonadota bacterium]|nr:MAPEG family protein [Pseudomonadota bacterium]